MSNFPTSDGRESPRDVTDEFATSRPSFEFVEDEDSFYPIEPAPEIPAWTEDAAANNDDEDDAAIHMTNAEIRQMLQDGDNEDVDYYTVLGLSREPGPNESQIRSAYHRLSLAFHPDRHPPHLRRAAESQFTRIQRAYETLIEPRKRVIYDLEGAEGVIQEYLHGGAMGPGGEASRELSAVKVMKPDEFKKWFLGIMHSRERRAIESLVESEVNFNIGLDATATFIEAYKVVQDQGVEYMFSVEPLRLQDIGVSSSFTVPLPKLKKLLDTPLPSFGNTNSADTEVDEAEDVEKYDSWTEVLSQNAPTLSIHGGVSGELDQGFMILPRKDQSIHDEPFYDQFYSMTTQQISLGVKVQHTFAELIEETAKLDSSKPRQSKSLSSILQGFTIDASANILPHPSTVDLGIGKAVQIGDSRPFFVQTRTIFRESPSIKPPEVHFIVNRTLGVRGNKTAFMQWTSGEHVYPSILHPLLTRNGTVTPNLNYLARWMTSGQASPVMALGMVWQHGKGKADEEEEADEQDLLGNDGGQTKSILKAYKQHIELELSHSFDLFARFHEPPVRSQIRNDGEAVQDSATPILRKSRGVRVEVSASVGLPVSFDFSVTGKRKVGTFTTVGLGTGVNALGLHLSLSWQRLGQSITVPVALLPLDQTTTTAVVMATALPWATYTAVEFLWIRPREAQKRRQLIRAQRKKLRSNIAKRKEEAEEAIQLMLPSVMVRQVREEESDGLVIVSAIYGAREKNGEWKGGATADVTVGVAALVDNGQLSLPRGLDKSRLAGFYDPCPLERKVLEVRYMFGGKEHRAEVRGGQTLVLPKREHEI